MAKNRRRFPAGPVPTIAQLEVASSWVWASCPERGCRNLAAIPLKPAIAHFGSDVSSDRLRNALRCTACGHRGALIHLPSWAKPEFRKGPPLDRIPPALQRQMARDALRSIGVEVGL
jgi:hypothetical protein